MTSTATASGRPRWLLPTFVGYRREWLLPDIVGGLSAGAVVVPQAMAYATIANLPVQVGLYTCILPMLVYALLGGSRAMSVSTTSTIATLTATTLVSAGVAASADDPDAALGSLVLLTLLVGAILLIAWLLRLGSLVESISGATVLGLKIGVGATVAVGQLPKLLGETGNVSGEGFINSLVAVGKALDSVNPPTVVLSVASILVLVLLQRFAPRVPGTLIVVVGGILLSAFTGMTAAGVALIDPVPSGFPLPSLPDFTHLPELVPGALAIAIMAFLESAAVARGIRKATEPQVDSNQELFATGAANVVGSFFTTMPAAGGFSQSAVNQNAGAKTLLSTIVTVALAILVALFLGPVLSLLPQATLAAMVFVAVMGLINIPELVRWARISRIDFWIALVVALIGLSAGLLPAVAIGVVMTLVLVLREVNIPKLDITGREGDALAVHLGRGLYTANAAENARAIVALATSQTPPVDAVVLDVERLDIVTVTILDALEDLDRELTQLGIVLHLVRLPEKATAIARKTPWFEGLERAGRVHDTVDEGLAAASV
ncbi:SulP family inorganic anion transporter [Microbacterium kyungheense]|uniref:MFS superfamily sulfate permease-like transporter n=1 Tax=Microbacterium kyungheense TaxID=1263636 RepID=A0A543EAF1_9MICO|nr:SulP family inorganic anion transporter [Microbacterium kyungheense]TQM18560.1 MFS superfamily sulfate permease-like transporter [Microbacterium kyungheense]